MKSVMRKNKILALSMQILVFSHAHAIGPKTWSFGQTVETVKTTDSVAKNTDDLKNYCKRLYRKQSRGSALPRRVHIAALPEECRDILLGRKKKSYFSTDSLESKYSSWATTTVPHISDLNIIKAWKEFKKKKEIVVAVIDTGIDPRHEFLKDNIHVVEGFKSSSNYGVDFSTASTNYTKTPVDTNGHGTHVSGIIKTVFPDVKILALKYYNEKASGQQNLSSTIKALEYAINSNVDVINYSGGGPEPAPEELKLLMKAEQKGILVVAAAGNEKSNIDDKVNSYYPASYGLDNIITVTAHNKDLSPLPTSNWGSSSVDISAPGRDIRSSVPNNMAAFLTGTSQATAFVSGVAALIKSKHPQLTAKQLKEIIRQSAVRETSLIGRANTNGRLDAYQAILQADAYVSGNSNVRQVANSN